MYNSLVDTEDGKSLSSLSSQELSLLQKKKKRLCIIFWIIFAIIIVISIALLLYFFVFTHVIEKMYWREVLHCRKGFEDKTSPMQFATLYNTKRGVILCGGGSDIHQDTARPTLFRSEDDGETWSPVLVGDKNMFSLYSFMEYPPESEHFIGLIPDFFARSYDNGKSWNISTLNRTGFSMNFNKENKKTVIISKNPDEIYRSEDGNFNFESINYCHCNGTTNIITKNGNMISKSNSQCQKNKIHTKNKKMVRFNSILSDDYEDSAGCDNLRAITYAGNNTWYMGVGGDRNEGIGFNAHARVFKSVDDGKTWSCVFDLESINTPYRTIFSVFAYNDKEVLIGTDRDETNLTVTFNHPGIYKTTDGGNTWKHILDTYESFDPTITIVRSFYLSNDGKLLFACLDCSYSSTKTWSDEPDKNKNSIIIVSKDRGETWELFIRTETKRLYWTTETLDGNFLASTGEYGQILKSSFKKERHSRGNHN
ncbi:hypothetical protein M9Y10_009413 [Tritrichomonas musculus]|uniref:Sortilin N-terminal domain-containing protein n=1 Tax=Tritrichomonas musculus TaxID=1915356 RepID=A0ABR2INA6_9EUKA